MENDLLLKQIFQCGSCEKQFNSRMEAEDHIIKEHSPIFSIDTTAEESKPCSGGPIDKDVPENSSAKIAKEEEEKDNYLKYELEKSHTVIDKELISSFPDCMQRKEESGFKCSICQEDCHSARYLTAHMIVAHEGKKYYDCDVCSKSFTDQNSLNVHKQVHVGNSAVQPVSNRVKSEPGVEVIEDGDNTVKESPRPEIVKRDQDSILNPVTDNGDTEVRNQSEGFKVENETHEDQEQNSGEITPNSGKITTNLGKITTNLDLDDENEVESVDSDKMDVDCTKVKDNKLTDDVDYDPEEDNPDGQNMKTTKESRNILLKKILKGSRSSLRQKIRLKLPTGKRVHSSQRSYECPECSETFNTVAKLQAHVDNSHTEDKPDTNDDDNKSYSEEEKKISISSNDIKGTSNKHFPCEFCKKIFRQRASRRAHIKLKHTREGLIQCQQCDKAFASAYHFKQHMNVHTGETPYECEICGKTFGQVGYLTSHRKTHVEGQNYQCKICEKSYKKAAYLREHNKNVHSTNGGPYPCLYCQNSFMKKSYLKQHLNIHTGAKPYKCDVCGKAFSVAAYLRQHLRIHVDSKTFKCDVCERCFGTKKTLKDHELTHIDVKPHKCDMCSKSFIRANQLQMHKKVHAGEKSFTCDICGRSFFSKPGLSMHIQDHSGLRPFKCEVCGDDFQRKKSLESHMFRHTKEKFFTCDLCGRSFTFKASLNKHMVTHTGVKAFECDICHVKFGRKTSLNRHKMRHTGEKPFSCGICGKAFARRTYLISHGKVHEKEVDHKYIVRKTQPYPKTKATNSFPIIIKLEEISGEYEIIPPIEFQGVEEVVKTKE